MLVGVVAQARHEDGTVAWGYSIEESVGAPDATEYNALMRKLAEAGKLGEDPSPEVIEAIRRIEAEMAGATYELLLKRLEEARESIVRQVGQDLQNLGSTS